VHFYGGRNELNTTKIRRNYLKASNAIFSDRLYIQSNQSKTSLIRTYMESLTQEKDAWVQHFKDDGLKRLRKVSALHYAN